LANYLFARRHGGRLLLRLDDTDCERSKPEYANAIVQDLQWLGIGWDEFLRHSDRLDRYGEAAETLKRAGLPFAAVIDRLPPGATEAFWNAVRGNLDLLGEARGWWDVVAGTIVPPVIEGENQFLRTALDLFPSEPSDERVNQLDQLDRRVEAGDRPKGQGAAPSAALGADRGGAGA